MKILKCCASYPGFLIILILLFMLYMPMVSAAKNRPTLDLLPPYAGKVSDEQPVIASPEEFYGPGSHPPRFKSVRLFPWLNTTYQFAGLYSGEVKHGNNDFENQESYFFKVSKPLFIDVNKDGLEEAVVLTSERSRETYTSTKIGVFTLDLDNPYRVYLVGLIPGGSGPREIEGQVKSIALDKDSVIVKRYMRNVKDPGFSMGYPFASAYRIESWHWDGKQVVQDESKARVEAIPERSSWPEFNQWCRQQKSFEYEYCKQWLPEEQKDDSNNR